MIKATRDDVLRVTEIVEHLTPGVDVPTELTVIRRSQTYYGPKLETTANNTNYLVTAPGPNTQLLLWRGISTPDNYLVRWKQLAEIKADFTDNLPQYDICPDCGEPIKSVEHERLAAFGTCLGVDP